MLRWAPILIAAACMPTEAPPDTDLVGMRAIARLPEIGAPDVTRCIASVVAFTDTFDYLDLQAAFSSVAPGSTLYVCPGDHDAPLSRTGGWPIALVGATLNPADTVIHARSVPYIFVLPGFDQQLRLVGLTMSGMGSHSEPSAVRVSGSASVLDIDRCIIDDFQDSPGRSTVAVGAYQARAVRVRSTAFMDGSGAGALNISNSSFGGPDTWVVIEDSAFERVQAFNSGPITLRNDGGDARMLALIRNTTVVDSSGSQGGAISWDATRGSQLHIQGSTFTGNTSIGDGGAVYITTQPSGRAAIFVRDSTFTDNETGQNGSAIYFGGGLVWEHSRMRARIRDSTFHRNLSTHATGDNGAISTTHGCHLTLDNVDMGTGADDNVPADIDDGLCDLVELGPNTNLDHYPSQGIFCELLP